LPDLLSPPVQTPGAKGMFAAVPDAACYHACRTDLHRADRTQTATCTGRAGSPLPKPFLTSDMANGAVIAARNCGLQRILDCQLREEARDVPPVISRARASGTSSMSPPISSVTIPSTALPAGDWTFCQAAA